MTMTITTVSFFLESAAFYKPSDRSGVMTVTTESPVKFVKFSLNLRNVHSKKWSPFANESAVSLSVPGGLTRGDLGNAFLKNLKSCYGSTNAGFHPDHENDLDFCMWGF